MVPQRPCKSSAAAAKTAAPSVLSFFKATTAENYSAAVTADADLNRAEAAGRVAERAASVPVVVKRKPGRPRKASLLPLSTAPAGEPVVCWRYHRRGRRHGGAALRSRDRQRAGG